MNGFEAFIAGAIQGLLEWLPVSSEAQTMLFMVSYLKMNIPSAFSYAFYLHAGTMLAVIIKFRELFFDVLKNPHTDFKLTRFLFFATLATAIPALPLYFMLKKISFEQNSLAFTVLIGILLIGTGIIMRFSDNPGCKNLKKLSDTDILVAGIAQGFAILPGISRSGITVAALLARKVNQETSLMLSFMMSVPATICLLCLDLNEIMHIPLPIAVILIVSSLSFGYLSMDALLILAKKAPFWIFCIIIGIFTLILSFLLNF